MTTNCPTCGLYIATSQKGEHDKTCKPPAPSRPSGSRPVKLDPGAADALGMVDEMPSASARLDHAEFDFAKQMRAKLENGKGSPLRGWAISKISWIHARYRGGYDPHEVSIGRPGSGRRR